MSMVKQQAAFLLDACKLIEFATKQGFEVTGGELYRTEAQQVIYFQTGKSKTMDSNHLKRLAIDLNFIQEGKLIYDMPLLEPIGKFWESLNPANRWGGHFKSLIDMPHFERNI